MHVFLCMSKREKERRGEERREGKGRGKETYKSVRKGNFVP